MSHLWCYSVTCMHLSVLFNAILVVNCVYVIAPVFGPAQLRVSFGVVKELTHDSRFVCVFVADACDICDVVVSGPYLRHCNPPGGRSLDSGPGPGMRQDADRDPYAEDRREGRLGSTSGCQGPSISGRESIWIESLVGRLPDCVSECGCCRRDIWYRCLAMPGSPCI